MVGHGKIAALTYPPDRTRILEVENVTIPIIVDTTRDVVMIGDIMVVIVVFTTATQTTVAAILLCVE